MTTTETTLRGNQLPAALKGTCCKDNSGQLGCQLMSIRGLFSVTKIRFTSFATQINKNPELFFLFLSIRMQRVALVDKTKF